MLGLGAYARLARYPMVAVSVGKQGYQLHCPGLSSEESETCQISHALQLQTETSAVLWPFCHIIISKVINHTVNHP